MQVTMDTFHLSHRVWCFWPWLPAVLGPHSSQQGYFPDFLNYQVLASYDRAYSGAARSWSDDRTGVTQSR